MPGIKPVIQDILARLSSLTGDNGVTLLPTVRVWNNQLDDERKGRYVDFAKPAAFLEMVNTVQYAQLGAGMQDADIGINIHLVHEWYDAQDGTFEDDLQVFDIRDSIVTALSYFIPAGCNEMIRVGETVDSDHDNLYHFIIHFATNLADTTVYNSRQLQYTVKQPPTDLQLDAYIADRLVYTNVYTVAQPTETLSTSEVNDTPGQTVFFIRDNGGASIAGAEVALVIKEVKPLRNNQWNWDRTNGFLTITDSSVFVDAGETLFILYTVKVS
jgi:hypothetical protein